MEDFVTEIENQYEQWLDSIFLHWKRGWISKDEMYHRRGINRSWFHTIYQRLNPWKEVYRADLAPEYVTKYDTQPDFPLASVIFYHKEEIPVYSDDQGQQFFAVWNGHEWSGGAYNFHYANLFCDELDNALEHQLWNQFEDEYRRRTED